MRALLYARDERLLYVYKQVARAVTFFYRGMAKAMQKNRNKN
jgi:hypothetical protein